MEPLEAVRAWRRFANATAVVWRGNRTTWAAHISGTGYSDEVQLLQPRVFPAFARELLGFDVGTTLAAEQSDRQITPDFTPADAATHPFVFETKSTNLGVTLTADEQVGRYLRDGAPRIRQVVLTNLVGLRVYELGDGRLSLVTEINLKGLLDGPEDLVATIGDARRLASFLDDYRRKELTQAEKIERVRQAPPWNPVFEVASPEWLSARLDRVVEALTRDVTAMVRAGTLLDRSVVMGADAGAITNELNELEWRINPDPPADPRGLEDFVGALGDSGPSGLAMRQYVAHVAYFAATRLLLVRIWEDLGLVQPVLYDGGFDALMTALRDAVSEVVDVSFGRARDRYPSLFDHHNNYTWYRPSAGALADAIYELANTYFGAIESDVLGSVYARLLERVDRKLLGQYYTPRDVIRMMWELLAMDPIADQADRENRAPAVLDIATGSGGFLVEAARRLRERFEGQVDAGAILPAGTWAGRVAAGLIGVEVQPFPAYLAEVNLLIQIASLRATGAAVRIPALSVVNADTLALHNPTTADDDPPGGGHGAIALDPERAAVVERVRRPTDDTGWFDIAVGNPPYVGEKKAASLLRRTRAAHPYWESFVAPHLDYLYWFLVLGVSKLRNGGRFAFITTEYWLRSAGGAPLRGYLAQRCQIDRILVFRDLRLFPDAPGQHSMVVVGRRVVPEDANLGLEVAAAASPRVSIYHGEHTNTRQPVLDALRDGSSRAGVRSHTASVSPNSLGRESWASVLLTRAQLQRRARVAQIASPMRLEMEEGVITGADRLTVAAEADMTAADLAGAGGAGTRPPIFVLRADEVARLGRLNDTERRTLRPVVNTRDVFPYAVVPRNDAEQVIYLPAPTGRSADAEISRMLGFPAGMPALEAHLRRFESVLLRKVRGYGERRPWWSIHRDRPGIRGAEGTAERWAGYGLTTRWGGGGRLLVGLAPRGVTPASGLHAVWPAAPATAAYLIGLVNSSFVQELAEGLPPGEIRQGDLEDLGLPYLSGEEGRRIAELASELAELVTRLVHDEGPTWPEAPGALRDDLSLDTLRLTAWLPAAGPPTGWGTLATVPWVDGIERTGAQAVAVERTEEEVGIFGSAITARPARGAGLLRVRLTPEAAEFSPELLALFLGLRARGVRLSDVSATAVPTSLTELRRQFQGDVARVHELVSSYRDRRRQIDEIVAAFL